MKWIWSDDPLDWSQQITALFTAASAVFTGVYVWLTYRLMRATARTAEIAFFETQRGKIEQLLPIRKRLMILQGALSSEPFLSDAGAARIAAVLSRAKYDLDALIEHAFRIKDQLGETLTTVQKRIETAQIIVTEVLADETAEEGSRAALTKAVQEAALAVEEAMECISSELEHARRVVFRS